MRRFLAATAALIPTLALLSANACNGGGFGGNDPPPGNCRGAPPPENDGSPTPVSTAEIALRTTGGAIAIPVADGESAAVTFAPQGGFLLLSAVRTTGFEPCVDMTAAIRDPQDGGAIVSLEQRPISMVEGGDGWLYPDEPVELYNWANLFVCEGRTRDVHGGTWTLEITVEDRMHLSTATRDVVPRCADADTYCIEICTVGTSLTL